MKYLKFAAVIFFLIMSVSGFAQKVKIKKDKALIDGVEIYNYKEEGLVTTLATISDVEFISLLSTSYTAPNPARQGVYGDKYPATITRWVFTVKFLKSGKELYTDMMPKEIIKAVYNAKMVDADGNIDEEKLNVFITKYNNENLKYKLID